jgi:quercetin dioxygenase-like cupin family protein
MDEPVDSLSALGALIEEWRGAPEVLDLTRVLVDELRAGTEPFVGRPLPDELVRGRLRAPVASAWVFVLRPRTRNPAHLHPSSTQYTAAISGGGTCYVGAEAIELEPFDRARTERTLQVIPAGTPHAFEPGAEPLVVLSFHSVTPEELVEIEVESGAARGYVGGSAGE